MGRLLGRLGTHLFNRANFSGPNTTIFNNNSGVAAPAFGQIRGTDGTARRIQIGMKILF